MRSILQDDLFKKNKKCSNIKSERTPNKSSLIINILKSMVGGFSVISKFLTLGLLVV